MGLITFFLVFSLSSGLGFCLSFWHTCFCFFLSHFLPPRSIFWDRGGSFHFLTWHYLRVFHEHFFPSLGFPPLPFSFLSMILFFLLTLTLFVCVMRACICILPFFLPFFSFLFFFFCTDGLIFLLIPPLYSFGWWMDGRTDGWIDQAFENSLCARSHEKFDVVVVYYSISYFFVSRRVLNKE